MKKLAILLDGAASLVCFFWALIVAYGGNYEAATFVLLVGIFFQMPSPSAIKYAIKEAIRESASAQRQRD
jgi:hypothetical protein